MKTYTKILILATALAGGAAIAAEASTAAGNMMGNMNGMMSMMQSMKTMDSSGDGFISKDEFMKSHAAMFDAMKKNKDGLVDMKDIPCS